VFDVDVEDERSVYFHHDIKQHLLPPFIIPLNFDAVALNGKAPDTRSSSIDKLLRILPVYSSDLRHSFFQDHPLDLFLYFRDKLFLNLNHFFVEHIDSIGLVFHPQINSLIYFPNFLLHMMYKFFFQRDSFFLDIIFMFLEFLGKLLELILPDCLRFLPFLLHKVANLFCHLFFKLAFVALKLFVELFHLVGLLLHQPLTTILLLLLCFLELLNMSQEALFILSHLVVHLCSHITEGFESLPVVLLDVVPEQILHLPDSSF
jgi:hypothetical protein